MSQTLWQQLTQKGLVSGEEPVVANDNSPWYVRTMLGIAGWFGALVLWAAVFSVFGLLIGFSSTAGILGLGACLVAVLIYRAGKKNDFLAQFAFAISLAGQSLLVFSILSELNIFGSVDGLSDRLRMLSIVTICLQLLLFFVISDYLHRMWSALLITLSVMFLMNMYGLHAFTLSILLAGGVGLWLQEFNWAKLGNKLTTPAYAMVFISVLLLFVQTFLWSHYQSYFWFDSDFWRRAFGLPSTVDVLPVRVFSLSAGVVLLGLVLVLLKRAGNWTSGIGIAAILLSILAAYIGLFVPGFTVGIILVLIGFAHSNRVLSGLGLVILVVFVFQFYYLLELNLLHKSGLLVASGLGLLVVRYVMNYVWPIGVDKHA